MIEDALKTYYIISKCSKNEHFFANFLYSSIFERYIVQNMNKKRDNQDHFNVMREIQKRPKTSQRDLAQNLGFSLGKLNYCLKALKQKGLIKIKNFEENPNKLNYIYVLTPKGISEKTKLTFNFMKRKMQEYDELKSEIEQNVDSSKN